MKEIRILFVFISCFFIWSCKKKGTPEVMQPLAPDVYVSGGAGPSDNVTTAHYWKNGQLVELATSAANPNATDIFVSGGDIYVTGKAAQGKDSLGLYWKNGILQDFTKGLAPKEANAITLVGKDVFIAGRGKNSAGLGYATYWKNGEAVMHSDAISGWAKGIFVNSEDVYLSGLGRNDKTLAKYWKNGVAVNLDVNFHSSMANAIAVTGKDVHVVGWGQPLSNVGRHARYWKNGVGRPLGTWVEDYSEATDMAISGEDIYIVGRSYYDNRSRAMIWKNGVRKFLPFGISASSVFVFNNDVYVTGEGNASPFNIAMYWKNGVPVMLSDGSKKMWANSIFVTNPK